MTGTKPNTLLLNDKDAERIIGGLQSYQLILSDGIIQQIIPPILDSLQESIAEGKKDILPLVRDRFDNFVRVFYQNKQEEITNFFKDLLGENKVLEQEEIERQSQELSKNFFAKQIGFDAAIAEIEHRMQEHLHCAIVINEMVGATPEAIKEWQAKEAVFDGGDTPDDRKGSFFERKSAMRFVDGNYLFQTIMQKWFSRISEQINSNDTTVIVNELIKIIGLENDDAVSAENIIALSEGKAFANNHLAKCLTAAVPNVILENTPFSLTSRANFYSFAVSKKNDSVPIIEASQHPTTYPFGEKILHFKERLWQLRTDKSLSMFSLGAMIDRSTLSLLERPYVKDSRTKNIIPLLPNKKTLTSLKAIFEEVYKEDWQNFYDKYYLPALWEYNLSGAGKKEKDRVATSENPNILLNLYFKTISYEEKNEFCNEYGLSLANINSVHSENIATAKNIYAPKRLMLRKFFSDNIKNPVDIGLAENYLDVFFPLPTQNIVEQQTDFKDVIEIWRDIMGLSQEEFAQKIGVESNSRAFAQAFRNLSVGTKLDKFIDNICDFIRTQTANNTELPKFTQENESQFRELARIKREGYKLAQKQIKAFNKAKSFVGAAGNKNNYPGLMPVESLVR